MSEVLVRIQTIETAGDVLPEDATESIIDGTRETLERIAQVIEDSCDAFVSKIEGLEAKPNEIGIEFGVDARGEMGIPLVTKGSIGANFKVSIKWTF